MPSVSNSIGTFPSGATGSAGVARAVAVAAAVTITTFVSPSPTGLWAPGCKVCMLTGVEECWEKLACLTLVR